MRTLAIDLGTRRVGLALSDEGARFANPYEVIEVKTPRDAADQIAQIVAKESVERLVVGIPLNMDGTIGSAAKQVGDWGNAFSQQCGIPIIFVDERLSSFEAEQQLNERKRAGEKLTKKRRKSQLDAIVAANLLQQFLDGKALIVAV